MLSTRMQGETHSIDLFHVLLIILCVTGEIIVWYFQDIFIYINAPATLPFLHPSSKHLGMSIKQVCTDYTSTIWGIMGRQSIEHNASIVQ